jgi:hypothetical protein
MEVDILGAVYGTLQDYWEASVMLREKSGSPDGKDSPEVHFLCKIGLAEEDSKLTEIVGKLPQDAEIIPSENMSESGYRGSLPESALFAYDGIRFYVLKDPSGDWERLV